MRACGRAPGKALRRTGFELAREAYDAMQPILKQMKELDLIVSDDGPGSATPQGKAPGPSPGSAPRSRR